MNHSAEKICNELASAGLPSTSVEFVRGQLSGVGSPWRDEAGQYPKNVAKAIQGLSLNGFGDCAGDEIVFPFSLTVVAANASDSVLVLKPRKPVWVVGMQIDQVTNIENVSTTEFVYAANPAYPSAGEGAAGFTRLAHPSQFSLEALRSDASPWPGGMLCNDEMSLRLVFQNSTAAADVVLRGTIFGVTLDGAGEKREQLAVSSMKT